MENKESIRQVILTLCLIGGLFIAIHAADTPKAVHVFYEGMKTFSKSTDPQVIAETELNMKKCFYGYDDSGITLPNDFRFFNIDKKNSTHFNKFLSAHGYISILKRFLNADKVLKVEYNVMSNTAGGRVPDLSGNRQMETAAYIVSVVEKRYMPANENSRTFIDTVITFIETGMIGQIINSTSEPSPDFNVCELRIKAAQEYERKNYYEAYALYEKIVSMDPKDAASLYYIGLMTYWQQGCKKKYPKKNQAKRIANDYLNRAMYYSHSSQLTEKIEHAQTSIKYASGIRF